MEEKRINQMSLVNFDLDEVEIVLGDKFKIVLKEGRYYAVRIKPKYPKTYEECCKVLHSDTAFYVDTHLYSDKLGLLYKLLICRDAYWKLSGNWKPDIMYGDLYCIGYDGNVITWKMQGGCRLLVFPTEEMRDAFYENFEDLIEECKDLL